MSDRTNLDYICKYNEMKEAKQLIHIINIVNLNAKIKFENLIWSYF